MPAPAGLALLPALLLAPWLMPAQTDAGHTSDCTPLWEKTERTVLTGFVNMYNPHIIMEPGEAYPYRMWFFGWAAGDGNPGYSGCDAIFAARGKTLDEWEVYCGGDQWDGTGDAKRWQPVVTAQDEPYDQWHNGDPTVVKHDGRYFMAYSSTGFDLDGKGSWEQGDTDGDLYCIMAAVSDDGLHWTKSERPILIHEPEIGVMERPEDPGYVGQFQRPSLLWDEGRWRLWFDYWLPGQGVCMGHAECAGDSLNAAAWQLTHDLREPVLPQWPNPDVVRAGGRCYAFADPPVYPGGDVWTARQVTEAVSDDGLDWQVLGYVAPDSDTPACHVPEALVQEADGRTWLTVFYACQIGGEPYNYRYDRIRHMRRALSREE